MKIILVVDSKDWAFGRVAHNLKNKINNHEINIIHTSDYSSYIEFLEALKLRVKDTDVIHFFWRDYLMECLNACRSTGEKFSSIFRDYKITTHIPDHLFISDDKSAFELRVSTMRFIDGYFVTSNKLYELYQAQSYFPAPQDIIYDNPSITGYKEDVSLEKDSFDVVWVGNSKWGEYLGYFDYKGLNEIIIPAIDRLKIENGIAVNFYEFDSSKNKVSNDDIISALQKADVLLITSIEEGTPLPLLEAMANSCAIISTDVGIASEVLPENQKSFLINRNSDALYQALKVLRDDKELLSQLKVNNYQQYQDVFVNSNLIVDKWINFFSHVVQKPFNDFKVTLLNRPLPKLSFSQKLKADFLYMASKVAIKFNLMNRLKQSSFVRMVYFKLAGQAINVNDSFTNDEKYGYKSYDEHYVKQIENKEHLALYSSYWSGVATSTSSFFGKNSLEFPYFSHEFPQVNTHVYLDRLTDLLVNSKTLKSLTMSGGTTLQMELAKSVKKRNANIKIYFAWHGSPAQWVDIDQYVTFRDWFALYNSNVIDGVISFKPDLSEILNSYDIKSFSVQNYIVDSQAVNQLNEPNDSLYKVGLFAAMFSWYKNPFPQLMGLGTIKGCQLVTNLKLSDEMKWITQQVQVNQLPHNLTNKRFIDLLSRLHVVLYVTNTECSPMIALEATSVLTPCIVGPAGNIFKGHKELEFYLVEPEVDNPEAIKKRLLLVRDNYSHIKSLLNEFKLAYNLQLDEIKSKLYKNLAD